MVWHAGVGIGKHVYGLGLRWYLEGEVDLDKKVEMIDANENRGKCPTQ